MKSYAQQTGYVSGKTIVTDPSREIDPTYGTWPIKSVRWPFALTIPPLVNRQIYEAWSPQNLTNISGIYDKRYFGPFWNAGGTVGTIILDLGTMQRVDMIRVTPRSSAPPSSTDSWIDFSVSPTSVPDGSAGLNYHPTIRVTAQGDKAPNTLILNYPIYTRYLLITGNNSASWMAFSEIEALGIGQ